MPMAALQQHHELDEQLQLQTQLQKQLQLHAQQLQAQQDLPLQHQQPYESRSFPGCHISRPAGSVRVAQGARHVSRSPTPAGLASAAAGPSRTPPSPGRRASVSRSPSAVQTMDASNGAGSAAIVLSGLQTSSPYQTARGVQEGAITLQDLASSMPHLPAHLPLGMPCSVSIGWRTAVQEVKEELLTLRATTSRQLAEQTGALRQELMSQRTLQSHLQEQTSMLRGEADCAVRAEREARLRDMAEFRSALDLMHARVNECHAATCSIPRLVAEQGAFVGPAMDAGMAQAAASGLEALARELQAERETRCARDADLHARLARDVGDLARRLEEHRSSLGEEIAATMRRMQEHGANLERLVEQEVADRSRESLEIRAIMDSVWQQAASAAPGEREKKGGKQSKYYLSFEPEADDMEERVKELVGDQEDINTLYEMVREALGDTVHLKDELAAERDQRARSQQGLERLERQVNTMQALLRDAAALSTLVHQATPTPGTAESGSAPKSQ